MSFQPIQITPARLHLPKPWLVSDDCHVDSKKLIAEFEKLGMDQGTALLLGKWSCFTMENATEHAILKSNTWYNIGGSIKNHCYVVWYASGILANHVASGSVGNCGYQLGPSHIWQFNGENDDDQLDFGVLRFQTKLQ
jgi:hypothetical protein